MGIAAAVDGKFNHADAEVIDHSPSVLTGNHFDLTIEPHHANFTGRAFRTIRTTHGGCRAAVGRRVLSGLRERTVFSYAIVSLGC